MEFETELDFEIEQAKRELRWARDNPQYLLSIGLDQRHKEMEVWQRLGYLLRLRRLRKSEHGNSDKEQ